MKARKRKNYWTRKYMRTYDWNAKCPDDCEVHNLETHNTCLVCPACKNSPYVPKFYKRKSEIKKSNRMAEQFEDGE